MEVDIYNQEGRKTGKIKVNDKIFGIKVNPALLYEMVRYYEVNRRKGTAKVKDRSEVSGGGKKPWRQKGTGRARHGSIRSPLWKGGGVTFGPSPEKKYEIKMNKKARRKALFGVLSGKLRDKEIIFLDKIEIKNPKTKEGVNLLDNLSKIIKDIKEKTCAFVLKEKDDNFLKAISNIKKVFTIPSDSLNPYFLLKTKYLVIEKDAIDVIEKKYLKEKDKEKKQKEKKDQENQKIKKKDKD